jgi:hypothetical protein
MIAALTPTVGFILYSYFGEGKNIFTWDIFFRAWFIFSVISMTGRFF